ncbi:MAG: hypothetical protein LBH62_09535 [Nitrososphaerota archaeon]|jgi:hypothetical protein|nr:hypothetical protein [Nitrososphaerota archaeon]
MDEDQLTQEEIEMEITQGITFHAVYAITCLYHLKPSKNIKKHYKKIPSEIRKNFEETSIEQGYFERVNNNSSIVVTAKGVDFLLENILAQTEAMINCVNTLKVITKTFDEDEYYPDDDYIEEEEDIQENKSPNKNIKRQEKRKQKRYQSKIEPQSDNTKP